MTKYIIYCLTMLVTGCKKSGYTIGGGGSKFDGITEGVPNDIVAVPEPTTWVLMLIGLVGLLIWNRRRK